MSKPALRAEEWAAGSPRLDWHVDWNVGVIAQMRDESDRHALAALALHGQPFGFTWDMVDHLRGLAKMVERQGLEASPIWTRAIADRIAALLPPRYES